MKKSLTSRALALMERTNCTAYAAAQKVGLANPASIYRALRMQKIKDKGIACPLCGAVSLPPDTTGTRKLNVS